MDARQSGSTSEEAAAAAERYMALLGVTTPSPSGS
jgi:hypothetical protein